MDPVKRSDLDTSDTTLAGSLEDSKSGAPPPVWSFRVLYTDSSGIVANSAERWDEAAPLGIGRRTTSPTSGSWLQVHDHRVSREHARVWRGPDGPLVEDLHSRNGSALN